jgi:hypothetical protein
MPGKARESILAEVKSGKLPLEEFLTHAREFLTERLAGGVSAKAKLPNTLSS